MIRKKIVAGATVKVLASALFMISALAILASPVSAIQITNVQVPFYEAITLRGGVLGSGNSENIAIAGQIVLTTDAGRLGTWCVDLPHTIYIGGRYTYTAGLLQTNNTGTGPATSPALTATQIAEIGSLAAYGNALLKASPTNWNSAAVQAAIWNIEYNTTATGSAKFNAELATVLALMPTLPHITGVQISDLGAQGQYLSQSLYTTDLPEPASFVVLGTGVISLAILRRRRSA